MGGGAEEDGDGEEGCQRHFDRQDLKGAEEDFKRGRFRCVKDEVETSARRNDG